MVLAPARGGVAVGSEIAQALGAPLDNEIKLALATLCSGVAGAKWVEPSNHLTLRFIGAVEDALAANITAVLSQVATPSFALTLPASATSQAYSLDRR